MSERVRETADLSRWAESDVLTESTPEHLYLDLLKRVLTRLILPDGSFSEGKRGEFDRGAREVGMDSRGGYVIVDDYGAVQGCRQATDEFRARHGVDEELIEVDWTCRFWRREREV